MKKIIILIIFLMSGIWSLAQPKSPFEYLINGGTDTIHLTYRADTTPSQFLYADSANIVKYSGDGAISVKSGYGNDMFFGYFESERVQYFVLINNVYVEIKRPRIWQVVYKK